MLKVLLGVQSVYTAAAGYPVQVNLILSPGSSAVTDTNLITVIGIPSVQPENPDFPDMQPIFVPQLLPSEHLLMLPGALAAEPSDLELS